MSAGRAVEAAAQTSGVRLGARLAFGAGSQARDSSKRTVLAGRAEGLTAIGLEKPNGTVKAEALTAHHLVATGGALTARDCAVRGREEASQTVIACLRLSGASSLARLTFVAHGLSRVLGEGADQTRVACGLSSSRLCEAWRARVTLSLPTVLLGLSCTALDAETEA